MSDSERKVFQLADRYPEKPPCPFCGNRDHIRAALGGGSPS